MLPATTAAAAAAAAVVVVVDGYLDLGDNVIESRLAAAATAAASTCWRARKKGDFMP